MKKLLIDIDVILDVLLKRQPFFAASANLWAQIEKGHTCAYLASHTVTTLFYLIRKAKGKKLAKDSIRDILSVFEIAPVDKKGLLLALELDFTDFEDAVQFGAAKQMNVDFIITRNIRHYRKSDIPVLTPDTFLSTLDSVHNLS
ncbi:MAG: PIN domain nuclease [Thermoplasmata archaeon]|nr:MAG: PIN domain nuclease [Thermoplasmata archaeon]